MQLPSKLLLSAIYEEKVIDVWYVTNTYENDMHIKIVDKSTTSGHYQFSVNLHELVYKCKEWAFDKGFVLKSYKKQGALSGTYHYAIDINDKVSEWLSNTEEEVVFKACEWILTQKDNS